jgi:hypothetical protein
MDQKTASLRYLVKNSRPMESIKKGVLFKASRVIRHKVSSTI